MKPLLLLVFAWSLPAATVYRLACGGPAGTDAAGNVWAVDSLYVSGGTLFNVGSGPVPYRSLRWTAGSMTYSLPVPNGSYNVTLKFIEPRTASTSPAGGAGLRVFDVALQNLVVLPALDVFALVGGMVPKDYTFPSVVVADGKITIGVRAVTGNAIISGIQIDSVDIPPVPRVHISSCEVPVGMFSSADLGAMFPGVYVLWACWNVVGIPARITSVRCASDVPGTVLDVMLPDATAPDRALKTILPGGPIACNVPPEPVLPVTPSGVISPDGEYLRMFLRISEQPAGQRLAQQIVIVLGEEWDDK